MRAFERLERRFVEGTDHGPHPNGQRHETFVDGAKTSVTGSMREPPQPEYRRGGRVENDQVVERWIHDEGNHIRSPSLGHQDVRFESPRHEEEDAEYEHEHEQERPNGHGDHFERRHQHHEKDRGHRG